MVKRWFRIVLTATLLSLPALSALAQGIIGNTPVPANALTTTVVTVKAVPGVLVWVACANPNAAIEYVQVFDTTSAVTLGTTAPKFSLAIGASTTVLQPLDVAMYTGMKIAATTTPTGSTAPGTALACTIGIR